MVEVKEESNKTLSDRVTSVKEEIKTLQDNMAINNANSQNKLENRN
jgi:cell division protein FtsB